MVEKITSDQEVLVHFLFLVFVTYLQRARYILELLICLLSLPQKVIDLCHRLMLLLLLLHLVFF